MIIMYPERLNIICMYDSKRDIVFSFLNLIVLFLHPFTYFVGKNINLCFTCLLVHLFTCLLVYLFTCLLVYLFNCLIV